MQVEIGAVLDGKVTGITNYGAFVLLPGGETGMVHISEVSMNYIENIGEHLFDGQEVKVKVISVNENGKIALSIKQALPEYAERSRRPGGGGGGKPPANKDNKPKKQGNWQKSAPAGKKEKDKESAPPESRSFEDMMASFKKSSDEKIGGIKRAAEVRRGNNRKG